MSKKRDQVSKIYKEKILEDMEIMKLKHLSSKKKYIYPEEKSDRIYSKYKSDKMDSDKRENINKIDQVKVSDILEDFKVRKLSSLKYVDNVETESDKKSGGYE